MQKKRRNTFEPRLSVIYSFFRESVLWRFFSQIRDYKWVHSCYLNMNMEIYLLRWLYFYLVLPRIQNEILQIHFRTLYYIIVLFLSRVSHKSRKNWIIFGTTKYWVAILQNLLHNKWNEVTHVIVFLKKPKISIWVLNAFNHVLCN